MAAIIDPDLLNALNGTPAGATVGAPITDPDFLKHLEAAPAAAPVAPKAAATAPATVAAQMGAPHLAISGNPMRRVMPAASSDQGGGGPLQVASDAAQMLTSQIPFMDRASAGLGALAGQGSYDANLAAERAYNERMAAQHPILSKVLGFGGGAAAALATAPEAALAAGASMGARALASAGTGAAYGALQGASEAPDLGNAADTARRAAEGAGIGSFVGAASPVAGRLIGTGVSAVANALGGGAPGIANRVANPVLQALEADSPQAVQQRIATLGPQAMLADAGPALLGKTQGVVLNSDDARSIAQNALTSRDAGTNARVAQALDAAVGPQVASPLQVTEAIRAQRTLEHQALPGIFQNSGPVDTSGVLATIGQGLTTARGPSAAVLSRARDWLMRDGVDAHGNPIRLPVSDAQTLQNSKEAIDTLIDRGDPALGVQPGAVVKAQGAIGDVRRQLNQALRDQVPGYAHVMDRSSQLARHAEAIEEGTGLLNGGQSATNPADLADRLALAANRPEYLAGLQTGMRGALNQQLGTKANDLLALRNSMQGEGGWNAANTASIFGQPAAEAITGAIDQNAAFRRTFNDVVQNSQTAQRQAAARSMQPSAPSDGIPLINPNMSLTGSLATGLKRGLGGVVNQFRANPTGNYGEIANILTAQGSQRDAYLSALVQALVSRQGNAATGQAIGNRGALAAALMAPRALSDRSQRR